jgi:hypothetical protein
MPNGHGGSFGRREAEQSMGFIGLLLASAWDGLPGGGLPDGGQGRPAEERADGADPQIAGLLHDRAGLAPATGGEVGPAEPGRRRG